MTVRRALIAMACITTVLTGCQTMRPVDLSSGQPLIARLAPNDHVRLWTRDGRILDLQVTAVEADALVSGEQRIPLKDVERLERRSFSWTRNALLLAGIGVALFLISHINPL